MEHRQYDQCISGQCRAAHSPSSLASQINAREEARDPIVDTPPDNTPPPNDQQPHITGTAVHDNAREWTTYIHPDGWIYHF